MFLLDAGQTSFEEAVEPIRDVLNRSGAEVLSLKKWDERRLAYEIDGRRRGLYVLAYFKVDPLKVTEIEHDVKLNERILRALILTADGLTEEKMALPTPAEAEPMRRESETGEPVRSGPEDAAVASKEIVEVVEVVDKDEADQA
jgi:small subunit ribosomal protein S6